MKTTLLAVRVDPSTRQAVEEAAKREHRNIGRQLDVIVRDWLSAHPAGPEVQSQGPSTGR